MEVLDDIVSSALWILYISLSSDIVSHKMLVINLLALLIHDLLFFLLPWGHFLCFSSSSLILLFLGFNLLCPLSIIGWDYWISRWVLFIKLWKFSVSVFCSFLPLISFENLNDIYIGIIPGFSCRFLGLFIFFNFSLCLLDGIISISFSSHFKFATEILLWNIHYMIVLLSSRVIIWFFLNIVHILIENLF